MATKDPLRMIPVKEIRENPVALRPVNKKSEEYTGLVDSVRTDGIITPISVREIKDAETGQKYYSLVDGLHRWNAAMDADLPEIPALILTADDAKVLELQLCANIHKVETRPVEYSKQLVRIFGNNPLMTQSELAVKLGVSPTWIAQRLNLTKLTPAVASLVDDGTISLSNAFTLAKLPPEEQPNFVDRAITTGTVEFSPSVNHRIKEIRDAKRAGKEAAPAEFVPQPHVRKLGELKAEHENPTQLLALIRDQNLKSPAEICKASIAWTLKLDPVSVQEAKAKNDAREAELAADKAKRKQEREAKKAAAAEEAQRNAMAMSAP